MTRVAFRSLIEKHLAALDALTGLRPPDQNLRDKLVKFLGSYCAPGGDLESKDITELKGLIDNIG